MTLPTLAEVHPPLTTAEAARNNVLARKQAKQTEAMTIAERIRNNVAEGGNVTANRLRVAMGDDPEPEVLPDAEQLNKVRSEINALTTVFPGVDGAYQREKSIASQKLCAAVAPDHTALVKDFASKLAALHASHIRYVGFLDAVESTQASLGSLRPVSPNALGFPLDRSGAYYWAFAEFRENGHISINEIPREIR